MLIHSLSAENFMKFASLRLEGMPRRGVIGIEGPNESGKSTIGEALLFAFFGRSRIVKGCPLDHLIRWESDHLRVEVEFEVFGTNAEPARFAIRREIDRFGTNYVKMLSLPDRREVAAGNREVGDFVRRWVRFDFFEFQHAFYHDQYDPRMVSPSLGGFVERMSGVFHMREAQSELGKALEHLEREFGHYQNDVARNLRQAEKYKRTVEKLPQLSESAQSAAGMFQRAKEELDAQKRHVDACRKIRAEIGALQGLLEDLRALKGRALFPKVRELREVVERLKGRIGTEDDQVLAECSDTLSAFTATVDQLASALHDFEELCLTIRDARMAFDADLDEEVTGSLAQRAGVAAGTVAVLESRSVSARRRSWWYLGLCLAAGVGAVALGIDATLDREGGAVFGLGWPPVLGATGVGLVGFLLFLTGRLRASGRLRAELAGARARSTELEADLQRARDRRLRCESLESLEGSGDLFEYIEAAGAVADGTALRKLTAFRDAHASVLGAPGGVARLLDQLRDLGKVLGECASAGFEAARKRAKELETAYRKATSDRDRGENEVRECEAQRAKLEALEEKNRELGEATLGLEAELEDHRLAIRLLDESCAAVATRIGPTLSRFLRELLPHLTGGRYRDVRIGSGLELEVFASGRSDFVPAPELSGGTNEALMLALRLAFAHAFIASRSRQPQFVFLDEPFKMMDVDRALAALTVLKNLSPDLRQFFVIQPSYTETQRRSFDCWIQPTVEGATLAKICE